jgi:hypothetical protein
VPPLLSKQLGALHVHRTVSEMKQSIDWYVSRLGFFYDHGTLETAWLVAPGILLTLSPGTPTPDPQAYFGFALGSLEALEAAYAKLHGRMERLSSPADASAGRPFFFLFDPDDYPVIFSYSRLDYPQKLEDEPHDKP